MVNLANLLKIQKTEYYTKNGFNLNDMNIQVFIDQGPKYTRFSMTTWNETDKRSLYFVENSTGKIFGCESWRKPNLRRQYGTLDTINDWYWAGYDAVSLKGINPLVRKQG